MESDLFVSKSNYGKMRLIQSLFALVCALLVLMSETVVAQTSPTNSPTPPTNSPTPPTNSPTRAPTPPTNSPTLKPTNSNTCPDDPRDTDGDGIPDCYDKCPNDFNKATPGICGCGVPDTLKDINGDGIPDCPNGAVPSMTGYAAGSDATNIAISTFALAAVVFLGQVVIQN